MKLRYAVPILGLAVLTGCAELEVTNPNAPDRERALSTPGDIAGLAAGNFLNFHHAVLTGLTPGQALATAADASSASWGNYGMQDLSSEPRAAWDNSSTYTYRGVNQGTWYDLYEIISNSNDVLTAMENEAIRSGMDNPEAVEVWAKFTQALGHAYMATFFDKGFVYTEDIDLETHEFSFQTYDAIWDAAETMFDDAIALAQAGDFTIPARWFGNMEGVDEVMTERVIHAFKARYMAAVSRDPTERAAADWDAIVSHATAAGAINLNFIADAGSGSWWDNNKYRLSQYLWSRADYKLVGPSDESGGYEAWLAEEPADRMPYEMTTSDLRINDPSLTEDDCEDMVGDRPSGQDITSCGKYIHFLPVNNFNSDRGTYHWSWYNFHRFADHVKTGQTGTVIPQMVEAEMDMLKVEGYLRGVTTVSKAEAVGLINKTRVNNGGYDPLTVANTDDEIWAAMLYEKRIETTEVSPGLQFFEMRGWGYLVEGTPLHFPIPQRELDVIGEGYYTFGGTQGDAATQTGCPVLGPDGICSNPMIPQ